MTSELSHVRGSVLVVDDEQTIADVVSKYLAQAGYATSVAGSGPAAVRSVEAKRPDLIVLDLMLPGFDGLEVMRRVRAMPGAAPAIILLTARGEESDRVVGLRLGADDYMVKPFSPAELVARVDAVLRRIEPAPVVGDSIEAGELRIDANTRQVFRHGEELTLTQREFDLLHFFARNAGQVFTRQQLMESVWQYTFYTDTSTVTVHIGRLRAKIEPDPAEPRYVQTVWGVGYRFAP